FSGGQRVEHDAERKDIRASVEAFAVDLLGSHVADLAFDLSSDGRPSSESRRFCDPEVDDLRHAVVSDEQVLRRNVAMDEADGLTFVVLQLVRGVEARAGVDGDTCRYLVG